MQIVVSSPVDSSCSVVSESPQATGRPAGAGRGDEPRRHDDVAGIGPLKGPPSAPRRSAETSFEADRLRRRSSVDVGRGSARCSRPSGSRWRRRQPLELGGVRGALPRTSSPSRPGGSDAGSSTSSRARRPTSSLPGAVERRQRPRSPSSRSPVDPEAQTLRRALACRRSRLILAAWSPKPLTTAQPEARVATPASAAARRRAGSPSGLRSHPPPGRLHGASLTPAPAALSPRRSRG